MEGGGVLSHGGIVQIILNFKKIQDISFMLSLLLHVALYTILPVHNIMETICNIL